MSTQRSNIISVGRVTGVFGIKGWVKVNSSTQPEDNILSYSPWWIKTRHGVKQVEVDEYNQRSQGLIVHFKGVDDRDAAELYLRADVAVERSQLPNLDAGDFYWHQLIGLKVISEFEGKTINFGNVKELIETGANDVIVVEPVAASIDDKERLVPYVPGLYVKNISLEDQLIIVEWDPEF